MKIVPQSAHLEWITPNAAQVIELAARTCYKSEDQATPEGTAAFLYRIVRQKGHHSVVEHASASFRIVCDRGVSHEIVRHRIASYSQESTRYCNYGKEKFGKEITVIKPSGMTLDQEIAWRYGIAQAEAAYFEMLGAGCTPQIARSVLPNSLKTEMVMTANFREWLHFIELRTSAAAHPQMREVAEQIKVILQRECPEIFGA
jgi:thymidylate synthase (FAD)